VSSAASAWITVACKDVNATTPWDGTNTLVALLHLYTAPRLSTLDWEGSPRKSQAGKGVGRLRGDWSSMFSGIGIILPTLMGK